MKFFRSLQRQKGSVRQVRKRMVLRNLLPKFQISQLQLFLIRWFSSMPGPTWQNRFFIHAACSGGLDDSPSGFQSATTTLIGGYRFENDTIFDRLDNASIEWCIFAGDSFPLSLAVSGMTLNWLRGRIKTFDEITFTQLGVRAPTIVVCPLIPRNIIDHSVYDHNNIFTIPINRICIHDVLYVSESFISLLRADI